MRECLNCEQLVCVFGNYVQCMKTGRFVDFYYWNGTCDPKCPLLDDEENDAERKEE